MLDAINLTSDPQTKRELNKYAARVRFEVGLVMATNDPRSATPESARFWLERLGVVIEVARDQHKLSTADAHFYCDQQRTFSAALADALWWINGG